MADTQSTRAFSSFEWLIAARYLRSRRKEKFVSVIAGFSFAGIMLGVATLIIVMAVMNGFRNELLSKLLGVNAHFVVQAMDTPLDDFDDVVGRLRGVDRVVNAFPIVEDQVLASSAARQTGALVRGMREADIDKVDILAKNVLLGSFSQFAQAGGVAIGSRLATQLGITQGDFITLIAPRGDVTPLGVTPRVKQYPVSAIFEIGMSEYDAALIIMPLMEAQLFFNQENSVSAIEVFIDDPDGVDIVRPALEDGLGRPALVSDWRRRNATFFYALQVEHNVQFTIVTLILVVAALNIISGLTMLVKDKGRDIAILRTMGASRGSILRVFFITGASIGSIGTLAGLILGAIFCYNIETVQDVISFVTQRDIFPADLYLLNKLPADIDNYDTLYIVLMALTFSFLATLYPAWRAAKLDPVEALRYE